MSDGWQPLGKPVSAGAGGPQPTSTPLSTSLDASPFARLARTHLLSVAGDTCVTVALAGSLFFDISPDAAKGRVALSLILTMAPFAVVAPLLGPLMDRFEKGRRFTVFAAGTIRALLCIVMADNLNGLALFPLAFGTLVLSKAHAVSKAALVPATVSHGDELVDRNSKLALCAGVAGFAAAIPAGILLQVGGGAWSLRFGALLFAAAAVCSVRLAETRHDPNEPLPTTSPSAGDHPPTAWSVGAGAPNHDGTTAEIGIPPSTSVAGGPRPGGDPRFLRSVLRGSPEDYGPGIIPAATAMAVLRGVVGFLTFFIAFSFRRLEAPSYWFGIAIAASAAGNLVGAYLAPRLRNAVKEEHIVLGALGLVAVAGVAGANYAGRGSVCFLAFVVGVAVGAARLAFDSLVQRDNPPEAQGRVFARFEALFQLVWVVAGLAPVLTAVPIRVGCFVVAIAAALGALAYAAELRGARRGGDQTVPPRRGGGRPTDGRARGGRSRSARR